jgi:hypothetical protein
VCPDADDAQTQQEETMTRTITITIATAIALLGAASASFAGATDGIHQVVSPPVWAQPIATAEARTPYALTGTPPATTEPAGWRRSVQRLGTKVEWDAFER